jgi:hypothetical protein
MLRGRRIAVRCPRGYSGNFISANMGVARSEVCARRSEAEVFIGADVRFDQTSPVGRVRPVLRKMTVGLGVLSLAVALGEVLAESAVAGDGDHRPGGVGRPRSHRSG